MRHLAHTAIAITTLIIILFSSSGVGLMTCACSGETTLVLPLDDGCCGSDRSCMTVEVLQMSDSEVVATLKVPVEFTQVFLLPTPHSPLLIPHSSFLTPHSSLQSPTSPPLGRLSMVMRV